MSGPRWPQETGDTPTPGSQETEDAPEPATQDTGDIPGPHQPRGHRTHGTPAPPPPLAVTGDGDAPARGVTGGPGRRSPAGPSPTAG